MSLRELIVLGTASQVPTRERNHHGCLLRWDERGMLFDPGEGTQRQLTLASVPASAITQVFITHFHGDHALGLASIVQRLSLDAVSHPVEIFYPETGQAFYERLVEATIYQHRATLVPRPLPLAPTSVTSRDGLTIEARPLDHTVDTLGYRLNEADGVRFLKERIQELGLSGPQVGELSRREHIEHAGLRVTRAEVSVPRRGAAFAFIMDTRPTPAAALLARQVDLLVAEATFLETEAEAAHAYRHMTALQAAELASAAGARALVLTHFSQRYASTDGHLAEARRAFPEAQVASDLSRHAFPRP